MPKTHRGALELTDVGTYSGMFLNSANTVDPSINGQICYVSGVGIRAYAGGAAMTIGAAGAGGATSWDALYDADKTFDVDVTAFTLNGTVALGANNVLTIVNAGTGKDIAGPAWSLISTGAVGILELTSGGTINASGGALTIGAAATAATLAGTLVVAGTAATTSITLTAGNIVTSAGGLSLTKAANNATFSVTNNTATSASVVVIAGSGVFTGTTTTSFMTITPSGMIAGTGLYMPLAAMTTGTGVHIVAAATTTGTLLLLSANTTFTGVGYYFRCYDGAANDFTIGVGGATTIAGTAATNVLTITAGDVVLSDASVTITDADDATSFLLTNNAAIGGNTLFSIVGAGAYAGVTTKSFVTIVPSGLTTGTAFYLAAAALTQGKGIQVITNALTSGQAVLISSSAINTITTTGRLLSVVHSGTSGNTAILSEFSSAATDETEVVKITVSAALALGVAFDISAVAMTTGTGIKMADLNALTDGTGLSIASSSTTISATGHLIYVNHSGNAGTDAILSEFASAAADETVILKVTASAALALGVALCVSGAAITTGKGIQMSDLNALTSGMGLHIASSAAAITTGHLVYVNHTGATGTSAVLSEFASNASDETVVVKVTASGTLLLGTALQVSGAAITTGAGITANDLNALTTGIGLHIASSSTALTGAGRLVYVNHTGNATAANTAKVMEIASAAAEDTEIFKVTASAALAGGLAVNVSAVAMTTGTGIAMTDLNALTSGIGLSIASSSTALTDAGRLLYINHSGNATAATTAKIVEIASAAADDTEILKITASAALAAGMAANISAVAMTTGIGLNMSNLDALTIGTGIYVKSNSADNTARNLVYVENTNAAATLTSPIKVKQVGVVQTHFYKVLTFQTAETTNSLWIADATTSPNGNLAATSGDICLNADSNKSYYCTNGGGSLWTALA